MAGRLVRGCLGVLVVFIDVFVVLLVAIVLWYVGVALVHHGGEFFKCLVVSVW